MGHCKLRSKQLTRFALVHLLQGSYNPRPAGYPSPPPCIPAAPGVLACVDSLIADDTLVPCIVLPVPQVLVSC